MQVDTITITITNPRVIDGFVREVNGINLYSNAYASVEDFVQAQIEAYGKGFANTHNIAVISSSEFILRFTPTEFANIFAASQQSPEIAQMLADLRQNPQVYLDDVRLLPGLELLVGVGLIAPERIPELISYTREEFVVPEEPPVVPEVEEPPVVPEVEEPPVEEPPVVPEVEEPPVVPEVEEPPVEEPPVEEPPVVPEVEEPPVVPEV